MRVWVLNSSIFRSYIKPYPYGGERFEPEILVSLSPPPKTKIATEHGYFEDVSPIEDGNFSSQSCWFSASLSWVIFNPHQSLIGRYGSK